MTRSLLHSSSASKGMNSMKRTVTLFSLPNPTKSSISSSLIPFITTMLIFTGSKPATLAASIPSRTCSRLSRLVRSLNRSRLRESKEILILFNPAALSFSAISGRVTPFVVIDKSTGNWLNRLIRSGRFARTVGSPVRRILSTPKRSQEVKRAVQFLQRSEGLLWESIPGLLRACNKCNGNCIYRLLRFSGPYESCYGYQ